MPSFRSVLAAAAAAASILTPLVGAHPGITPTDLSKRTNKFGYGAEKVRGVNLGGWLVLEPWITPSIFSSEAFVDEYTFGQVNGPEKGFQILSQHWKTWITEADFANIAGKGLNHVRIPIGWWAIDPIPGNPYIVGAYPYLNKAIGWAGKHGIKVMIDLHGAPGSQNGFDNSGRRGAIRWTQNQSIQRTQRALNKIRDDHAANPAVASIEILNEPMASTIGRSKVTQFYNQATNQLANHNVGIVFHDAFEDVNSWNNFGAGHPNLILDTHHYEVFDPNQLVLDGPGHVGSACDYGGRMSTNSHPTISGEWTGAMTDCAKWLNGLGVGARYDGTYNKDGEGSYYIGSCAGKTTGTVAGLDPAYRSSISNFIQAQMQAYEFAAGWIFWTWKTEAAPEWDFQALSNAGVIPNPVTARANMC